jgi:hypothetical protein
MKICRRSGMKRRPILVFYVLFLSAFFLNVCCQNKAKEEAMYALRVGELADVILVQSSSCINQVKAYSAVWEYSRVTGEDFDSAARHILGAARAETKGQFNLNKMNIDDFMQKVENPPDKYKSSHEKLLEMYGTYIKLNDLALKPTTPQKEYEASVYKLYDKLLKEAGELNTLLER